MNNKQVFTIDSSGHARITGPLTLDSVAAVYSEAGKALEKSQGFSELDLSEVTRVDSSGLALLLEWQSAAHGRGNSITIRNASEDLISLAKLCESDDLLTIENEMASNPGQDTDSAIQADAS